MKICGPGVRLELESAMSVCEDLNRVCWDASFCYTIRLHLTDAGVAEQPLSQLCHADMRGRYHHDRQNGMWTRHTGYIRTCGQSAMR